MQKGKKRLIVIILMLITILIIGSLFYFEFGEKLTTTGQTIKNPVEGLTDAQAVQQFNEKFVVYLLASIGANKLHNPPFSSDTPKIQLYVSDDIYRVEIKNSGFLIGRGNLENADIIIRTTKEEGVKMLRNKQYVKQSFVDSKSEIELVASKAKLFAKGYMNIYNEFA